MDVKHLTRGGHDATITKYSDGDVVINAFIPEGDRKLTGVTEILRSHDLENGVFQITQRYGKGRVSNTFLNERRHRFPTLSLVRLKR